MLGFPPWVCRSARVQDISPGLLQQAFAVFRVLLKHLFRAAPFVPFDLPTIHIRHLSQWLLGGRQIYLRQTDSEV